MILMLLINGLIYEIKFKGEINFLKSLEIVLIIKRVLIIS
jgi:hypothetical protein